MPASTSQTFTITPDAHYHIKEVAVDSIAVGAVGSYTFPSVKADHTISATFEPDVYTIYATAGANGSISPSGGAIVPYGEDRSYTIRPSSGYDIDDVVVDGRSAGAVSTYTFANVDANHNITARFRQRSITYLMHSTADEGGTITPEGALTATQGSSLTYTITPNSDYRITAVTVDGISVGAVSSYTFNDLDSGHSITATFEKTSYTITASAGTGGSITPEGQMIVASGATQSFSATAIEGYRVAAVSVDGVAQGSLSTYVFRNVKGDHTIEANFSPVDEGPVVDAGPDQTVEEKTLVTLSGTNSMDPDDGIAAFRWRQVSGPTVELADPTADQTTFIAPAVDEDGAALVIRTHRDRLQRCIGQGCMHRQCLHGQYPADSRCRKGPDR